MDLIAFILRLGQCEYFDASGVKFDDKSLARLVKTPDDLTSYEIPSETEVIAGGTLKSYSAFYPCQSKLTTLSFQIGSKLKTIEQYGLNGMALLTELDMSMCENLLEITNAALADCKKLATIILPPNLQSVTAAGMQKLIALKRLDFPSSFTSIGGYHSLGSTISGCTSLAFITWGENPSIKSIGQLGLSGCKITSLHIPLSLTSIGQESLYSAPIVEFIVDEGHQTFYAEGMWLFNPDKTKLCLVSAKQTGIITLPDSVVTVGAGALIGCQIESVVFGNSVQSLGADSLMYSTITHLSIPNTVTSLGSRTLFSCTKLVELEVLAKVVTIPGSFVYGCTLLERIVLPRGVEVIIDSAFAQCANIDYIFIPNTVVDIRSGVFKGINKTAIIEFEEGSTLKYENGYFYNSDYSKLVFCIIYDSEFTAVIRSSVQTIDTQCFGDLGVTSVIFDGESKLQTIGEKAFVGSKISSISFPASLQYIHKQAFYNCPLVTVTFNSGMIEIKDQAFYGTQIIEAIFPDTLSIIGQKAFESCLSLTTVTFGRDLIEVDVRAFALTKVESIEIPTLAISIGDSSFAESELSSLTFSSPSTIDTISIYAFKDCTKLTNIHFAPEIKGIGEGCFQSCSLLQTVEIGSGVENIYFQAFKDCQLLANVKIPDTSALKSIGSLAFDGCRSLKIFEVSPDNPSFSTDDGVLFDHNQTQIILYLSANERQSFDVPNTVAEISIFAFQNAAYLERIHLGNNIVKIGYGAFSGCTQLAHVNIPTSLVEIGDQAFNNCPNIGCGSISYDSVQRDWLINRGVPLEGLTACTTYIFTKGNYYRSDLTLLITKVLITDEI